MEVSRWNPTGPISGKYVSKTNPGEDRHGVLSPIGAPVCLNRLNGQPDGSVRQQIRKGRETKPRITKEEITRRWITMCPIPGFAKRSILPSVRPKRCYS